MGVSIREYARMRGVSHTAVVKAVSSGRISAEPDGSIDPEKANALWEQNSRPRVDSGGDAEIGPAKSGAPDYKMSRAIREAYAARLAKLEFEERSGKLTDSKKTESTSFLEGRRVRDRILQLPRKLAHAVVAEWTSSADVIGVESVIDDVLRDALTCLSRHDTFPTHEMLITAADSAWRQWHNDMDEDDIPRMNPSFERGFLAGVQWVIGQEQEENP